jgi:hypothetical protein
MKPAQLRKWMRKYGNLGVLMVAGYLGLRHLRMYKRHVLVIVSGLFGLITALVCLFYLRFRPSHQAVRVAEPIERSSSPLVWKNEDGTPSLSSSEEEAETEEQDLLTKATKISDTTDWDLHTTCGIQPYQDYFWASPESVFYFRHEEEVSPLLCRYDLKTEEESVYREVSKMWSDDGTYKKDIEISPDGEWVLWTGDYHPQDYSYHGNYGAKIDGSQKFHVGYGPETDIGCGGWKWMPDSRHFEEVTGRYDEATEEYTEQTYRIRSVERPQSADSVSRKQVGVYSDRRTHHWIANNRVILVDQDLSSKHGSRYHLEEIEVTTEPRRLHRWTVSLPNTIEREEMQIAPDGQHLAWILFQPTKSKEFHEARVCISRMDGSQMREIGHMNVLPLDDGGSISADVDSYPHRLKWLPDGNRLSFLYKNALYTVPTITFPRSVLIAPRFWKDKPVRGSVSELDWSPDGAWAIYWISEDHRKSEEEAHTDESERESVCCIRRDGTHARLLYSSFCRGCGTAEAIRWAPDSRHFLCWKMVGFGSSVNADGSTLFDVDVRNGAIRTLSGHATDGDDGMMRGPNTWAFSPDGKYLLLVHGSGRFMLTNKRLARIEYATGKWKWLTERTMAATLPEWSPDGHRVAYIATPDPGTYDGDFELREARKHLWVVRSDGKGRRQLTHDPGYRETEPHWQEKGDQIEFVREENTESGEGMRSLWRIRADGTGLHRIRSLPPVERE